LHVSDRHREQGVGKALIEEVCQAAKLKGYRVVGLEVQNTNMPAISFYRKVGFLIEAVDLSFYTNNDIEDGEVAIFMKRKL
jgi:ribosomal protein S18 acetylase RimI-like enzyme